MFKKIIIYNVISIFLVSGLVSGCFPFQSYGADKGSADHRPSSPPAERCREFIEHQSPHSLSKLPPEVIASLNLNDMSPVLLKSLSRKVQQHITREQLAALLPEKVARFSSEQFMGMPLVQFSALDLSQVSPYIIRKLSPEHINHAKSLTLEQKQVLEYYQIKSLESNKFKELNLILIIPVEALHQLPDSFFDTITINQIDRIDDSERLRILSYLVKDKDVKEYIEKKVDKFRRDRMEAIERETETSYQTERR